MGSREEHYATLPEKAQLAILRRHALSFCDGFGLMNPKLKLVNHGFNTTYRVEAEGKTYAMRINVNSIRSLANIRGELAMTNHLSKQLRVMAARPAAEPLIRDWQGTNRPLIAALYDWLPGRNVAQAGITANLCKRLGALTTALHEQFLRFSMPTGAKLDGFVDLCFGKQNHTISSPHVRDHDVWAEVFERNNEIINRLNQGPIFPIHFDLHFWNLRRTSRGLGVLDFDDSLMGCPAYDVMITLFYLRRMEAMTQRELEPAYWAGLAREIDHLEITPSELEMLVAGRAWLLANDLLSSMTSSIKDVAPQYIYATEERMKSFLKTGKFVAFQVDFPQA